MLRSKLRVLFVTASIDTLFTEFAKTASLEHDTEGIDKYLMSVIADESPAKKCIALEIIYNLIADRA